MPEKFDRPARPHLGGDVVSSVLPGGLRLVTEDMPGSHTLALGFFIPVGSRHERDFEAGCAHFLEHALFKGTPTRTAAQISGAFDAIGGEVNAFTSKEYTCFHAKVLADDTATAVSVLTDMLTNSMLNEDHIEDERTVILDEMAMHADDPGDSAHQALARSLFGEHPMGRPIIGTAESIRGLSPDTIAGFWHEHYRPECIVVSAAGRVDHEHLRELLSTWDGPRALTPPVVDVSAPAPHTPALIADTRTMEQTSCVVGFRGVGILDPERFPLAVLAMILGGGMSSRLFLEVREYRGWAYHIEASAGPYTDCGQFTIEWQSAPHRVADILGVVADVVASVARDGVSNEELSRAKGQIRGQTLLAFEAPDTRMMRLGRQLMLGDSRTMNDMLDATEAVTAEAVQEAARRFLGVQPTLVSVGAEVPEGSCEAILGSWASRMVP